MAVNLGEKIAGINNIFLFLRLLLDETCFITKCALQTLKAVPKKETTYDIFFLRWAFLPRTKLLSVF